jgi:hypothetical protein
MNRILLILTVLLLTGLAPAQTPHFYVSGAAQWSEPMGDFGKKSRFYTRSGTAGNAESGGGGEINVGLMSDYGSTYVGYRWTSFGEPWDTMNRFTAGLRWHMFGTLQSPAVPLIGAGITVGKSTVALYPDPERHEHAYLESETSVGWFVEGGLRLRLVNKLSLFGSLQYHQFDANFEDAVFDENDPLEFDIEYFTTCAGLQFYF